ncbi:hypothetical protein GCM10010116_60490 [Microbispora rosea subsp. aerata]|nr:hypothetical protein [Microbispora rosea]GGO30190.1 hypothetical protein GCM10010116_60490 [Microbispora rosea subsp. aerata]GIH59055.1 hypothetical protein Mro02_59690 [Microbispora rosea subsp. aerata]GLJ87369.1 hypothetical protein GCM10017588_61140 [Microbispora rosea subsp. aerata]
MTDTTTNPPEEVPGCECGARLEQGQTRCFKCIARNRWARRQTARRRAVRRRAITRRPPRGPLGAAALGVIWS